MNQDRADLLPHGFGSPGVQSSEPVDAKEPIDLGPYRQALLDHIRGIVRDPAEAEDVLQEVLVKAHQSLGQLRAEAALTAWLFRIATHVAIDHLRGHNRRAEVLEEGDPTERASDAEDAPGLQRLVEQQEMSACVQRFLLDLPSVYRTVLLMHDLDGMTAAEIASSLGITLENAKIRLHRARVALRAALQAGCTFSCDERGVLVCEPKR
jgi:RNA polymerase sigma-70 factor (ECF subfamily)